MVSGGSDRKEGVLLRTPWERSARPSHQSARYYLHGITPILRLPTPFRGARPSEIATS